MKTLGFIFALLLSPFVHSNEITVSKGIEVLAIDGVKIENSFFAKNNVNLENGQHQLVVKYNHKFRSGDKLETKPYIFDVEIKGETQLTTNTYSTYAQAEKKLKQGLVIYMTNQSGQYNIDKVTQLKGQGFMPYRDIEKLIREFNQGNNINSTTENNGQNTNKNYLIEQYKAASQEQKNQFKTWLIQH